MSIDIPTAGYSNHETLRIKLDRQDCRIAELEAQLTEIANIAHHGGLIGKDIKDIRGLTLPYWDMEECNRLQALRDKPCTK